MVRRRGPGLLRTAGRAAVISSVATASSRTVHNAMDRKAQQAQQAQQAEIAAMQTQQEIAQMQAQLAAVQPTQPTPAPDPQPDLLDQLTRLGQLKEAGVLTEDEFQLAKAKLLS